MQNSDHDHTDIHGSSRRSWLILFGMAGIFLTWGFFLFFMVGDKSPADWDYSVIEDIPGQSPYSTARAKDFSALVPEPMQSADVPEQHVMGPPQNQNQADVVRKVEGRP